MVRKNKRIDKEDQNTDQNTDKQDSNPVNNEKMQQVDINTLEIDMEHHVFIGGITQSGKSYFMKHLFDSVKPANRKCIFFDYKNDPDHVKWFKKHHYPVFKTIAAIKRYWSPVNKIWSIFKNQKPKSKKIIYRPARPKGFAGAFNMLEELSDYVFTRGNMILFIDEIAPLTDGRKIPVSFYDCLIMGAARGVTCVSVSQRPKDIHNIILSEAYTKILFRLNLEDDRKKIRGIANKDVAESLHNLPNTHFIFVRADGYHQKCRLKSKE